jgi:hypothetical protein
MRRCHQNGKCLKPWWSETNENYSERGITLLGRATGPTASLLPPRFPRFPRRAGSCLGPFALGRRSRAALSLAWTARQRITRWTVDCRNREKLSVLPNKHWLFTTFCLLCVILAILLISLYPIPFCNDSFLEVLVNYVSPVWRSVLHLCFRLFVCFCSLYCSCSVLF